MLIELKIPAVGESVTEVEIGEWLKHQGEFVQKDESVVVLESDKATVELPAPVAGTLKKVVKRTGDAAGVGETIAELEAAETKPAAETGEARAAASIAAAPLRAEAPPAPRVTVEKEPKPEQITVAPAVSTPKEQPQRREPAIEPKPQAAPPPPAASVDSGREQVVRMSKLRRTIAQHLVEAQHEAALLTTFNEIDMGGVMALRSEFGEAFQKRYGVKLGFMSFFVKAVIDALKHVPELNAEIRGENIVYKKYLDIGIAIGTGQGLVVPVLRDAAHLSFAETEKAIAEFGMRAKESKLTPDELQGGSFTITNGGIYGSLLSTPIINPPQSGVLGMHAIQERPVARTGQAVIRPMMYVALTYDHRIVDGREAVTFLKRVKETIETPARMLLEV